MKCLGLPVVVNLAGRMAKLGFNPAPDKRAEHDNTTIPSVPAPPQPEGLEVPSSPSCAVPILSIQAQHLPCQPHLCTLLP